MIETYASSRQREKNFDTNVVFHCLVFHQNARFALISYGLEENSGRYNQIATY